MESVAVLWAAIATTVTTTTAVTTTVAAIVAVAALVLWAATGAVVFLLVYPALHANDAVKGAGFGEAVVKGNAERLKWHFAFAVAFSTGDVRTAEAAGATETDTFGTEFHGGLQRTLHGAAERDTALKLNGDLLGNELRVKLRLADLDDVDLDLGTFAKAGDVLGHHFDFLTLATDDQARA